MKIKISLTDDDGTEFEGEIDLQPKTTSGKKFNKKPRRPNISNFNGVVGGIELLISQGFFKLPKTVKEITEKLSKEGYYYQNNIVDRSLRREFYTNKKILTRIRKNDLWHYVLRK